MKHGFGGHTHTSAKKSSGFCSKRRCRCHRPDKRQAEGRALYLFLPGAKREPAIKGSCVVMSERASEWLAGWLIGRCVNVDEGPGLWRGGGRFWSNT